MLGRASNPAHSYGQTPLLALLKEPGQGDASVILTRQLIAAKLNIAKGANPTPISQALTRADGLMGAFAGRLPYRVPPRSPIGHDMTSVAQRLEAFNTGRIPGNGQLANRAPIANAGSDQTVSIGSNVSLDGSGSTDPDFDRLTFQWTLLSRPSGSQAVLSSPKTAAPTLIVDVPGTYEAQLIVNDGVRDSAPDKVRVSTINSAPSASAGPDQTRRVAEAAQLDGSASRDPDGDPLTFAWTSSRGRQEAPRVVESIGRHPDVRRGRAR